MTYTTLIIIWFALWGLLWAVYFMLDGFDLGVGMLYPFLAKDENERKLLLNSIGPFWDGNEVWLITAGGATFAAFPTTYAVMFSFFYLPFMLILLGLIFRGTAIEFMNKSEGQTWKDLWKWALAAGSFLVAFLFGVAFANIFHGLPIDEQGYHGTLISLLNSYGILGGLLFTGLFILSGSIWIGIKTDNELSERVMNFSSKMWYGVLVLAVIFLVQTYFETSLYDIYIENPIWLIDLAIAVISLLLTKVFINKKDAIKAFITHSLLIVSTTFFGIIGLYPNMLPSSIDSKHSLTVFNSASSEYTLKIMFIVAIIFVPIVIFYQIMMYKIFSGKITEKDAHY
ncbi:cytochrome d ubiquinol oxidase subunit II [Tepidibacillus fermentans]|uniref:Cytochrome bd-I ubiquinol oxidase subunit 2 apoprotein n=1 Tax=Tepidibacillus fermentans TaxID=1281767 RepID=A0A4R3KJ51_9BACI|nr:cytochrome d ubiquinol oxidase subunit II [Tepidibacillus fermentans]TCS83700.1 cytochrome bd-I ubiquinol oxidase subunit 2 apoprotein [Tepidibacillus fermentans]